MALQKTHNFRGITVASAYFRIVGVQFNRPRGDVLISMDIFASPEQQDPFDGIMCSVPYASETGDVIEWAYTEVKKVPEFAGAVDV